MTTSDKVINSFKNQGHKITKTRVALVDIFIENEKPISVPEILNSLQNKGISKNKTTIYRELEFLISQDLIHQVDLRERGKKYEYNYKTHHHHLICIKCKNVEDFHLDQDLDTQENKILEQKGFKVLNHSLEFFGLCQKCVN